MRFLVAICVAVSAAHADDITDAAAKAKKDPQALKALAETNNPDPWRIADELCARGDYATALALASASKRIDLAALPKYLARRVNPAALRAALARAQEVVKEPKKVLALIKPHERGDDVPSARAAMALGHAQAKLFRYKLAMKFYLEAAARAERIGWLFRTSEALRHAIHSAERNNDFRRAAAFSERRIALARKRKSPAELALAVQAVTWYYRNLRQIDKVHAYVAEAHKLLAALTLEDLVREGGKPSQFHEARTHVLIQRARMHWDKREEAEGVKLCQQAAAEFDRHGIGPRAAQARGILGEHLMKVGNYRDAAAPLAEALAGFQKLQMATSVAWVSGNLGWTLVNLGKYDEALTHYQRAYKIAESMKSTYYMARNLTQLSIIHERKGNYESARELTGRAVGMLRKLGNKWDLAGALSDLGVVHWRLAEWDQAFARLNEALRLHEEVKNASGMSTALSNLGLVHQSLSDFGTAIKCYERALALAQDVQNRVHALNNIALALASEGRFAEAQRRSDAALELARKMGDRPTEAAVLGNIASYAEWAGNYKRALSLHREALSLKLAIGDRTGAATTRMNIGYTLERMGKADAAEAELMKARAELRGLPGEADVLVRLGAVEDGRKRHSRSRAYVEEAKRIFLHAKNAEGVGWCDFNLGETWADEGDPANALEAFERARAAGERLGHRTIKVFSWAGIARVHYGAGRHAAAIEAARAGLEILPELTGGLAQEQGAAARSRFADVYKYGLSSAARSKDTPAFLHFLESGRAGALLEALRGRASLRAWVVPKELEKQEAAARGAEAAARQRHQRALKQGRRKTVHAQRAELDKAREVVREVVEKIRLRARAAASMIYPEPAALDQIRGWVRNGEAFVLYAILEDDLAALVITPDETRVVQFGGDDRIWQACGELAKISADKDKDPAATAKELQRLVVEPLGLGKDVRLLVSPDGFLCYVPLTLSAGGREVVYVPSATTYGHLTAERDKRGKDVLALGDPDYGTTKVSMERSDRLGALPATRLEVKAVGNRVLLGKEASETNLRKVVGEQRWRAVHLACHGVVDAERPMLSSLALSADASNDGMLTMLDVFRMKIASDLVVLSACETAKGTVHRAEGVMGFTRAFMFAGTPRVIVSLWKVDDKATRALMEKFYENWKTMPAATALKKAQDFVRGQDKWKHPYFWAAWQLWGLPD